MPAECPRRTLCYFQKLAAVQEGVGTPNYAILAELMVFMS